MSPPWQRACFDHLPKHMLAMPAQVFGVWMIERVDRLQQFTAWESKIGTLAQNPIEELAEIFLATVIHEQHIPNL